MRQSKKKADKHKTVPIGNYKIHATPKDSNLPVHQRVKKEEKPANAMQQQHAKRAKHFMRGDTNKQLNDRIVKEENSNANTWIVSPSGNLIPINLQALRQSRKIS